MTLLRKVCDDTGAALIYDEVQSGLGNALFVRRFRDATAIRNVLRQHVTGRTGSFFAFGGMGVPAPDMLTLAKPLGISLFVCV